MKQPISIFALALLLAACGGTSSDQAKTEEKQEAAAATGNTYAIDTVTTTVDWRATHKGGFAPRFGIISVNDGNLSVENGAVTAGSFTIDLTGLKVDTTSVTEPGKKAADLEAHLKSPDFFDAAKHPTAAFVITKVAPYDSTQQKSLLPGATNLISGNLTLKDSTLNITFPAQVTITDGEVTAHAKFTIDRSAWGISYKTEGSPENWMISKDVEIGFNLKAAKK
ncbi:YceI family protein [Niabella drilacis]|uniref:Polyisoprenoid-binding protein YceI n=1 Tax=Niabella drilacis (strain DSM 25811 / CCM 8410 / CCUG 62505 / LMG 26954 / E90) TaxID=1285928 RepID=A0A1G6L7G5_NIADE|nr:YceI family protein [Niabella drilacis]SDC39200.1 Polyisoprenoid-binding protein YceI [Niabella drilacis]